MLNRNHRSIDGKTFLDDKYSIYCKLFEGSQLVNKEINDRLVPLLPPPSGGRGRSPSSSTATALLPISDASMFESPFSCPTILSFSDCRNAVPSDATEPAANASFPFKIDIKEDEHL